MNTGNPFIAMLQSVQHFPIEPLGNRADTIKVQSTDTVKGAGLNFYNPSSWDSPSDTPFKAINKSQTSQGQVCWFDGTINHSNCFSSTLVTALQLLQRNPYCWWTCPFLDHSLSSFGSNLCYFTWHGGGIVISVPWWHYSCFLETFPGQQCYTALCITPPFTCLTTSVLPPLPHAFTCLCFSPFLHLVLALDAVHCSICLLLHCPTVEEGNTLQPHSQQAHPNCRMGNLQALPSCFHPQRRTQAVRRKLKKNQKQKFTLFLTSHLM